MDEQNKRAWTEALDFQAILDAAPDAIMLVDGDGVIRLVNQQAGAL